MTDENPMKMVLATDGSEDAALAAQVAADIANETASELHVVYAEPVPVYGEFPSGRLEINEAVEKEVSKRAQWFLDEQVEKIRATGASVSQAHLRLGRIDEEIVTLAEEIGAGLVVVGSRGLGGLRRVLMGSVSDSVVRHAHCPVMVVRGEEDGEPIFRLRKRILLATDGSEEAEMASKAAVELAASSHSELHVVAVGGEYHPGIEITADPALFEETLRELEGEAQQGLDKQVMKIEEARGKVAKAHLRMGGRPDNEIVSLAEEIGAGLIVMGSRGLGGIRRALMGSVSDSVVRHAHCPVMVVRK
jgi:nucleotide-binding universal stress UspA family protein